MEHGLSLTRRDERGEFDSAVLGGISNFQDRIRQNKAAVQERTRQNKTVQDRKRVNTTELDRIGKEIFFVFYIFSWGIIM